MDELLINLNYEVISFEDNTTAKSWSKVRAVAEAGILAVVAWLNHSELYLNVKKTVCIIFANLSDM